MRGKFSNPAGFVKRFSATGVAPAGAASHPPVVGTLILATGNRHKADEIRAFLGPEPRCLTLRDLPGVPSLREEAASFAGNARQKALELLAWLRAHPLPDRTAPPPVWVLADDSGLEVDALGGAPGVHSARFAATDPPRPGNTPDADNNAKLLDLLRGVPPPQRRARFRCVLALVPVPADPAAAPDVHLFEGRCGGHLLEAPRGEGGFGYDPLFVPEDYDRTFAELPLAEKNRLSHRARALEQVRRWLAAHGGVS